MSTAKKVMDTEFQSATEKDADEISRVSLTELRMRLPEEKRIKVLMLALDRLENRVLQGTSIKAKQRLIRFRLQQLCAKENTFQTIRFENKGQDFSEWDLDRNGCVIDCRVFQASIWCGSAVMNHDKLRVGGNVIIFTHHSGKLTMKYRIAALTPGPAAVPKAAAA